MKKRWMMGVIAFLAIAAGISYGIFWAFYDMDRLPKGDFKQSSFSPTNEYEIRLYEVDGGATTAYAVRGELLSKDGLKENIYWGYREEIETPEWLSPTTVRINGKELSVPDEKYDFRREN